MSPVAAEWIKANVALGLLMLTALVTVERVKFREWINGDLSPAYVGSNIASIPEQIISITLRR
jgi:hypothetical protein